MLNPNLDIARLHARFADRKRVVIPDVLSAETVESVRREVSSPLPWNLSFSGDNGPEVIRADALARATPQERVVLQQRVQRKAMSGFAFAYGRIDLIPRAMTRLPEATGELESREFLKLIKDITGDETLVRVEGYATAYRAGCFSKTHDDCSGDANRRFAFVLDLTEDWQPDWGGLLHFVDERGQVEQVVMPDFNSLTLFELPRAHFVSYVADYVREGRFAVSGWAFRAASDATE